LVTPRSSPSPGSSAQLGFYAIGVTVVQLANVLSQFGMDNGVVRYVAHYRAEGDHTRVRGPCCW